MRALIIATAVLAGCAELPAIEGEACGNGVVDLNEDCDSNANNCDDQCRVTCPAGTDEECSDISGGAYLCGADFICHAPSGVFAHLAKPSFSFIVGQGAVTDMDGDKIGDVIGFSDITIDVRFGDLAGDLTTRSTTLLPYTNASIAIRQFDPATRQSDIIVPTPDGIAAYTASGKQLVSYPFSYSPGGPSHMDCLSMGDTYDPVLTFELDKKKLAFVSRNKATGRALLGVVDLVTTECKTADLCGLTLPQPMNAQGLFTYDHYETQAAPLSSVIAIGVATSAQAQDVCAMRFSGVAGNYTLTSLNQTPTTPIGVPFGTIAFARAVPAAVCPALFLPSGTGIDMYTAAGTASTCSIALAPTAMPGFSAGDWASGRIPLQPAIAGRAPDALVTITGVGFLVSTDVYALSGTATYFMYHSPRPLYPVVSADLDGDGTIEAVAGVLSQGPQGQPDLDVLYRTAAPVESFVPYRIATQGVPTHMSLGDYDGNSLTDIAYTERVGASQLLMVAYGTRDRPLPAVPVTAFQNVVTLARVDVPDSIEPTGQVLDDLLVADLPPMAENPTLTVLHGNPQRSMLAYFDPRDLSTTGSAGFVNSVTGNFVGSSPATDVLAFEATTSDLVRLYVAEGTVGGQQLSPTGAAVDTAIHLANCSGAPLCLNGAEFLPWSIDGRDVVIAVDAQLRSNRTLVTIDPLSGTLTRGPDLIAAGLLKPEQFVFAIWPVDLEGKGHPKLVVSIGVPQFAQPGNPAENKVLDCTVDAQGVVTACVNLVDEIEDFAGWTCQSAAPGRLTGRGRHDPPTDSTDMVVLCKNFAAAETGVFRLVRGSGAGYRAERVYTGPLGPEFMSLGDVNGDRLDDIGMISFDATFTPVVDIHVQCDARDQACRNPVAP